jgi:hypothetical protein
MGTKVTSLIAPRRATFADMTRASGVNLDVQELEVLSA